MDLNIYIITDTEKTNVKRARYPSPMYAYPCTYIAKNKCTIEKYVRRECMPESRRLTQSQAFTNFPFIDSNNNS
jgi:hypothetical protein